MPQSGRHLGAVVDSGMGTEGNSLKVTEYWPEQHKATSQSSWWGQSNWFRVEESTGGSKMADEQDEQEADEVASDDAASNPTDSKGRNPTLTDLLYGPGKGSAPAVTSNAVTKTGTSAKAKSERAKTQAAPGGASCYNRFSTTAKRQAEPDERTKPLVRQGQIIRPTCKRIKLRLVKLEGVGGFRQDVMNQITDYIILPMKEFRLFGAIGVKPSTGVLLTGSAGTGKSLLMQSIADQLRVHYHQLNGAQLLAKDDGGKTLTDCFQTAVQNAPSIIFIDQIEQITAKYDNQETSNMTILRAALRQQLDDLHRIQGNNSKGELTKKRRNHVLIVGATSSMDSMDDALLRQGRFDRNIVLSKPDEKGRLQILKLQTQHMRLGPDVNLQEIAELTNGYVGADIAQLCTEAGLNCIREGVINRNSPAVQVQTPTGVQSNDSSSKYSDHFCIPTNLEKETIDGLEIIQNHFIGALDTTQVSGLRGTQTAMPKVKWDDIGGTDKVKRLLIHTLEYPLTYPQLFAKFGMAISAGVLLYGPPGCGKTLLAEAIAEECKMSFISVKGPQLLSPYFGESEKNVREIFAKARQNSPCVLFFDELDSITRNRKGGGGGGGDSTVERVLTQLLVEIDGCGGVTDSADPVFIVAATNRPDMVDPAMIRPGRFDNFVYVGLPNKKNRFAILKTLLRDTPLNVEVTDNEHAYLQSIAEVTKGWSGADLAVICNKARSYAIDRAVRLAATHEAGETGGTMKDEDEYVTLKDLERARKLVPNSVTEEMVRVYDPFRQKAGLVPSGQAQQAQQAQQGAGSVDAGASFQTRRAEMRESGIVNASGGGMEDGPPILATAQSLLTGVSHSVDGSEQNNQIKKTEAHDAIAALTAALLKDNQQLQVKSVRTAAQGTDDDVNMES